MPGAAGFTRVDLDGRRWNDGVGIGDDAATTPAGAAPVGGWPAIILLAGLGQTPRAEPRSNMLAEKTNTSRRRATRVLTFDTRGNGLPPAVSSRSTRAARDAQERAPRSFDLARRTAADRRAPASARIGSVVRRRRGLRADGRGACRVAAIVPVTTWTDLLRLALPAEPREGRRRFALAAGTEDPAQPATSPPLLLTPRRPTSTRATNLVADPLARPVTRSSVTALAHA